MVKNHTILLDRTESPPGELPLPGAGNTGRGQKLRSDRRTDGQTDSKHDRQTDGRRDRETESATASTTASATDRRQSDTGRAPDGLRKAIF